KNIPVSNIVKGKALAVIYCKSCHLLPDPSSLNSKSWEEGVLPNMGPYLGIFNYGFRQYPSLRNDRNLSKDFYPSQPLINLGQWQYIIDYYTATSPDSLPAQSREKAITFKLPDFEVRHPATYYSNPAVTFIKIDTVSSQRHVMLYDDTRHEIVWFDTLMNTTDSLSFKSP